MSLSRPQGEAGAGAGPPIAFNTLCAGRLERLLEQCRARGFVVDLALDGEAARRRLLDLIPLHADVTNGSSQTLKQIGFMDDLRDERRGWRYRRAQILREPDDVRREQLRRAATTADYIVGSVNALALSGEAVCVDHGGTRVGAYAYGAENVIWVVGTNKIVDTLDAALARVRDIVFPLEAARVRVEMNTESVMAKTLIISGEHKPGRIRIILVDEQLGY